jgi:hypothetical protein
VIEAEPIPVAVAEGRWSIFLPACSVAFPSTSLHAAAVLASKGRLMRCTARNKRTRTLLEAAEAGGEMPLDFLLRLMRDPQSPIARRIEAALGVGAKEAAAPFVHPKLQAHGLEVGLIRHS